MCARRSDLRRIEEVAALEGAAAFGSVWLAQWSALTGVREIVVGGIEVCLPCLTAEGISGELDDPRLAMMAVHECACIDAGVARALQREWEARGRELG